MLKKVTRLFINEFKIKQIGMDFMGYELQKGDIYTFHHLVIPKRRGGVETRWNGAILCGKSSHPYLHLIECKDYDMFEFITAQMIEENIKGYLDITNIRNIHDVLNRFEKEYSGVRGVKGRLLIKDEYTRRRRV